MRARNEDQDNGPCKRGCCWTPFSGSGICPKKHDCDHHKESAQSAIDKEIAEFARLLNVAPIGGNGSWIR